MNLLADYLGSLGADLRGTPTGTFSGSYVQELKLHIEDLEVENIELWAENAKLREQLEVVHEEAA